jgi:hypothetical protein
LTMTICGGAAPSSRAASLIMRKRLRRVDYRGRPAPRRLLHADNQSAARGDEKVGVDEDHR